ncbi:hypothetical protein BX616_007808 [Lobosporangium transversale]|nr:hypothetical protein BX616_007808 [Lobosporangium transversale]
MACGVHEALLSALPFTENFSTYQKVSTMNTYTTHDELYNEASFEDLSIEDTLQANSVGDIEEAGSDSESPLSPSKSRKKPCRLFMQPLHEKVLLQAIISNPPFAKDDRTVNQRWQSVVDRVQQTDLSPLRIGPPIYSGVTVRNARSAWEAMAQDHKKYLREKAAATGIIGEEDERRHLINLAYELEQEAHQQRTNNLENRKRVHEAYLQNNRDGEALREAAMSRAARKRSSDSSETSSSTDISRQRKMRRTRDNSELSKLVIETKEYLEYSKAAEAEHRADIKEILRAVQSSCAALHELLAKK